MLSFAVIVSNESLPLFARTIRGIEWIAAAELETRCSARVTKIRHREVEFEVAELRQTLLQVGTVDDVFLKVGFLVGLDHTRATLAELSRRATKIDFEMIKHLEVLREIPAQLRFDVIASFLGRRNYNRYEVEDSLADAISRITNWSYEPQRTKDSAPIDLSFRIHLADDEAIIGVRLSRIPLHRRTYKTASIIATLHPPLAFAMVMLSDPANQHNVLDPFCGVGTIPIEALTLNPTLHAYGVDIDPESITKANSNAESAKVNAEFTVGDAAHLSFADGAIDRIVSNPPWGQAVEIKGQLRSDPLPFFEEIRRVSTDGASSVFLLASTSEFDELTKRSGLNRLLKIPVSLFGSWIDLTVLRTASEEERPLFDPRSVFGPALYKYLNRAPRSQD